MNNKEAEMRAVVSLMTKPKGYSDSSTEIIRQQILVKMFNSYDEPELVEAVRVTLNELIHTTASPLEVADCILAWCCANIEKIPSILNGVRKVDVSHGNKQFDAAIKNNTQGLALGCFEAVALPRACDKDFFALLKYLGFVLGGKLWAPKDYLYTSCVSGRMTTAMKTITCYLWIPKSAGILREFFSLFSGSVGLVLQEQAGIGFYNLPQPLHKMLVNELCANFFLAAFPFQRLEILAVYCASKLKENKQKEE